MFKYSANRNLYYSTLDKVDVDLVELTSMFNTLSIDDSASLTDDEMETDEEEEE